MPGLLLASLLWIGCFALVQWRCTEPCETIAAQDEVPAPGLGKLLPTVSPIEVAVLNSFG